MIITGDENCPIVFLVIITLQTMVKCFYIFIYSIEVGVKTAKVILISFMDLTV